MGIWVGEEQKSFQAVIDGFKEVQPDVTVKYNPVGDNLPTVLGTAVQGGNPPDVAAIAQPGLMTQFVEQGELKPLELRRGRGRRELRPVGRRDGFRRGLVLRPALEGEQRLDRLVQRQGFRGRGARAAEDLGRVPGRRRDDQGVRSAGLLDRRSGRLDAHRSVREHLPPHRGAREVRPALQARDPVDRPVGQRGADGDGEGLRRERQPGRRHVGGVADRLPDLRQQRLRTKPEGGDGDRGRLRPRRRQDTARGGDWLQLLHVPVDQRLTGVGGREGQSGGHVPRHTGRSGLHASTWSRRSRRRSGSSAAASRPRTRTSTVRATPILCSGRPRRRLRGRRSCGSISAISSRRPSGPPSGRACGSSSRTCSRPRATSTGSLSSWRQRQRRRSSRGA